MQVQIPAALLPYPASCNVPGKAVEGGPRALFPGAHLGDPDEAPGPSLTRSGS